MTMYPSTVLDSDLLVGRSSLQLGDRIVAVTSSRDNTFSQDMVVSCLDPLTVAWTAYNGKTDTRTLENYDAFWIRAKAAPEPEKEPENDEFWRYLEPHEVPVKRSA